MTRIGLLSDTHGYWDDRYLRFFADCDEIWHAGDIGGFTVYQSLLAAKPLRAVYGNTDGYPLRQLTPLRQHFCIEDCPVLMTHIGGYPGRYAPCIPDLLRSGNIKLFISGHSHILKVMYDPVYQLLHINPGAAGRDGFHQVRTLLRFNINGDKIQDLEIEEIPK